MFTKIRKRVGIVLLAVLFLFVEMPSVSYAAKKTTAEKIKETEEKKQEVDNKKQKNEKELEKLKEKEKDLKSKLGNMNEQLTVLSMNLMELDQKIREKEEQIVKTKKDLQEAKELEEWQYQCMTARIQMSYERGDVGILQNFIVAAGFGQSLNSATYQQGVAGYDDQKLDEIIENRKYIEQEENRLLKEQDELEELKKQTEAEKTKVNKVIAQLDGGIDEYEDLISDVEKQALEYEKQLNELEGDLKALKKKLKEEQAMSQKAREGVWRDISEVSFSESDRKLLANLIYCEAGGEPYEGKLAVGAVVVNRILSGCYPDTMVGVVYQKGQFSPAKSGRLELALASNKANESCYRAADEAMSGLTNVGNCVYFRTPVEGLEGIVIGGHVFY